MILKSRRLVINIKIKHEDLIGKKFGRLTIKGMIRQGKTIFYDCLCDCGTEKIVRKSEITRGSTKSCGCLTRDRAKLLNKKYNKWRFVDNIAIGTTSTGIDFYIDLDDYENCKNICWHTNHGKQTEDNYIYGSKDKKQFPLHQFLLGKVEGLVVDHINHNTMDNRRKNLRMVTLSENAMNQRIKSNNTSGVKGVRWHKATQKWQVDITVNQKQIYLGVYENFDEAVKVRKQAEEKYFGEYSLENSLKGDVKCQIKQSLTG